MTSPLSPAKSLTPASSMPRSPSPAPGTEHGGTPLPQSSPNAIEVTPAVATSMVAPAIELATPLEGDRTGWTRTMTTSRSATARC